MGILRYLSYRIFMALLILLGSGCSQLPVDTTEIWPVDMTKPKVGKTITVGTFIDNRFPFWPRKEANPPLQKSPQEKLLKDFEPPAVAKEIRIPVGEVRSRLSHALRMSNRFEEIINPPTSLTGDSMADLLKQSLETCDYLVVGEVNSFHVKDMGPNNRAAITIPLDVSLLALPNLVVVLVSGGRSLLLSGGLFAVHTAECILTMSVTVYSADSGKPLATFRVESRAHSPMDAISVYGDLYNEEDDWIDFGRKLGDIALANACNQATEDVAQVIQQHQQKEALKKKEKPSSEEEK